MEDRASTQRELKDVKQQLRFVEQQIQELIRRQEKLVNRKTELEEKLLAPQNDVSQPDIWSKNEFKWSEQVNNALKNVFNLSNFRPLQHQTINVTMACKDCILIMPTGGGKSLCYQLPAVISSGITLVISPLVSLMEDQLMALENLGIYAALLNASSTKEEVKHVHDAMTNQSSNLKLLYVTPEKLKQSKRFMSKVEKMYELGRLARIAIDEVHCCSQWGHDFRPDYKFLGILKRQFPSAPILGLTATATSKVLDDIKTILNIPKCVIFQDSFNRPNLYYEIRPKSSNHKDNMEEMQKLIKTSFPNQSGIIYCLSQKDSEDVARDLQTYGIKTGCYHARLDAKQRSRVHKKWLEGQIQVVVATIAFGMGIDKPDVRFVIHHSVSKSMENYYQESGRAGRDHRDARCILYFRLMDVFRQSTMVFTEQGGLEKLYNIIGYCLDTVKCRRTMIARHFGERWDSALCNKMCDHCSNNKKDVTRHCQEVLNILEKASLIETRLTAAKLVDAWLGKGPGHLKAEQKTSMIREQCEIVIGHMLLNGYLREDFHFTPYTTISYLITGAQANMLKGGKQVLIEFPIKSSVSGSNKRLTTERPSSTTNTKVVMNQLKPKFSVDPERSKSNSGGIPSISVDVATANDDESEIRKSARLSKSLKIAVSHIEMHDEDNDDGDVEIMEVDRRYRWAEPVSSHHAAIKRPNSSNSGNNTTSSSSDLNLSPLKVGPRKKQKTSSAASKTDRMEVEEADNEKKLDYVVLDSDDDDDFVDEKSKKVELVPVPVPRLLEAKSLVTNILRKRNHQKVDLSSTSSSDSLSSGGGSGDVIAVDDNDGEMSTSAGFKLRSWFSDENIDKKGKKTLKEALIEAGVANLENISEGEIEMVDNNRDDRNSKMDVAVDGAKDSNIAKERHLGKYENLKNEELLMKTESVIEIKSNDIVSFKPKSKVTENLLNAKNDFELSDVDCSHVSSDNGGATDDVSQICRVYAKQLSTIDTRNGDSSEDDESTSCNIRAQRRQIQPAESMETIDEADSSLLLDDDDDADSIEESLENIEKNLPRPDCGGFDVEETEFTPDSEAELEQLKDIYQRQLAEFAD
ncbi:uncharacterized protein LOC141912708 isoform X2 [Tubulanus polymorphus]|uniref:uncharacterized protein LOC141912708 isoform X2 n=1 Tax=Tubulanus polymorphus TaxID=672921 RepID=UPI003DA4E8B9